MLWVYALLVSGCIINYCPCSPDPGARVSLIIFHCSLVILMDPKPRGLSPLVICTPGDDTVRRVDGTGTADTLLAKYMYLLTFLLDNLLSSVSICHSIFCKYFARHAWQDHLQSLSKVFSPCMHSMHINNGSETGYFGRMPFF